MLTAQLNNTQSHLLPKQDVWVADFLLTFDDIPPPNIGRTFDPAWQPVCSNQGNHLWQQPPSPSWRGAPMLTGTAVNWQFWLLGELYDTQNPHKTIADMLLGHTPAANLNGHFLLWAWQADTQQWHIWTNRFGTFHAYMTTGTGQTAVGTYAPAVSAYSNRQLDWQGLTSQFTFGFFAADRTHFEDVRLLRPATHYVFERNGRLAQQDRYWQWSHQPNLTRSYDDTVAEFAALFELIMAEQTRDGRIGLPISGGLDSRSTVAALQTHSAQIWPFSYGYSADSVETHIARQIAEVRNLPFTAFTIQPYLFEQLPQILDSVESFQDVTQCRQAAIVEELRHETDALIAAHMGDLWLDTAGLESRKDGMDETAVAHFALKKVKKQGREWLINHLCQPQLGQIQAKIITDTAIQTELAKLQHITDPDFRVKAFKIEQWVWRWTNASLRMYQAGTFPRLPFYDTRLADFFCTVPTHFLTGRQLQIDYLKRAAPDLARITWQAYDVNLFQFQHFNSWQLPKRIAKKARRMLTQQKVLQRNWEVQFLSPSGYGHLRSHLLRSGLHLHEFIAPQTIKKLLETFYAQPNGANGYTVSMLLTFATWLERHG